MEYHQTFPNFRWSILHDVTPFDQSHLSKNIWLIVRFVEITQITPTFLKALQRPKLTVAKPQV